MSMFKDLGAIRRLLPALLASAAFAACEAEPTGSSPSPATQSAVVVTPTLNTYITSSLEIDQLGETPAPDDANLFVGADPADGSASREFPTGGPATFIDWDDLGGDLGNHQLLDLDAEKGKDPSSFPRANECVGASSVLSKMDLTYVASANNQSYAYLAVQRSNNNGDAGYYWLFTRKAPHRNPGEAPCRPSEDRLLYDISGPGGGGTGDVLLAGHFHPNGTPLLRVFRASESVDGVDAVSAINFESGLWIEDESMVAAVAVNTTPTDPGLLGADGVVAMSGSNVEAEIFAEAAVDLALFTGDNACGVTFYGSVITRSSGSGGTSPDVKDLAGPALFNFGGVTAEALMTPTCDLAANYSASATGLDGQPLENATCEWTFRDASNATVATSSDCEGIVTVPDGTGPITGTVSVSDGDSQCGDTATTAQVAMYPPLQVGADLIGTCDLSFGYSATIDGGSGAASCAWTFSGTSPQSTTSAATSGSMAVGDPGSYTGSVVCTDARTDIVCSDGASDSDAVYAPVAIDIAPQAVTSCDSDAATFQATVLGGSGSYTTSWLIDGSPTCAGLSVCTIDPADTQYCGTSDIQALVSDGVCGGAASEIETYEKVTTIEVSNLP